MRKCLHRGIDHRWDLLLSSDSVGRLSRFRQHVFVCTNERAAAGRPSCAARGSRGVLAALMGAVARDESLCDAVAVTEAGCLGPCFDGPNAVVYPDGVWYAGLAVADIPDIVRDHLCGGEVVARLVYSWPGDGSCDDDDDVSK